MWRITCVTFKYAEGLTQHQRNSLVGCAPRRYRISTEKNIVEVEDGWLIQTVARLRSFGVTKFSIVKVDQPKEISR